MDDKRFDQVSRLLGNGATRRALLGVVAALTGLSLADAEAKHHRRKRRRQRRRKKGVGIPPTTFCCKFKCLDGQGEDEFICLADVTSCDCRCAHSACGGTFVEASQVASCDLCGAT